MADWYTVHSRDQGSYRTNSHDDALRYAAKRHKYGDWVIHVLGDGPNEVVYTRQQLLDRNFNPTPVRE
jgi:hypothetical protein